jgi:hypothetical protein
MNESRDLARLERRVALRAAILIGLLLIGILGFLWVHAHRAEMRPPRAETPAQAVQ